MIIRPTQKLNAKIKGRPLPALPLDPHPLADWSARLFFVDGIQYILLSNTRSFYATLFPGKGITDERQLIKRSLEALREFLEQDELGFVYDRFIAPASAEILFAGALNRSVSASMTRQVLEATYDLLAGGRTIREVAKRLNHSLLSALSENGPLDYGSPRPTFLSLIAALGADEKS